MEEHPWFNKLGEFLKALSHCKTIVLRSSLQQDLIFPKELRGILPPLLHGLKSLEVHTNYMPSDQKHVDMELVEGLLWLCPYPEALDIVLNASKKKSIKFWYDYKLPSEDDLLRRKRSPLKCWKHYLEKIVLQNFSDEESSCLRQFFTNNAMTLKEIERN